MVLASKIVPPAVPHWSFPRPALERRLGEALGYRLTTLIAGAGFGKSTLLAGWGAQMGCVWYTIDQTDAELATFAPRFLQALQARVPAVRQISRALAQRSSAAGPGERIRAGAVAAQLSDSLQEHVPGDLVVVLDDLHELDRRSPAAWFLEALCRNAPAQVHLVLSSRFEPPFPIERLRARGHVLALDPAMLAFSREEVSRLLELALGADSAGWSHSLHELTGGWPAAVRLAVEALRTAGPDRLALVGESLRRPGGALFSYLAEEVFTRESRAIREFLRRIAPVDRFTVELCQAVGLKAARTTLGDLIRRGLFVQAHGGPEGWFTLHALIREFALENWPLTQRELRTLHTRAAAWFESRGYLEEALRSLTATSDPPAVARLLSEKGLQILARGAAESVIQLAQLLPPELRDRRVEEVLGEAYMVRGEAGKAEECFRRAAGSAGQLTPGLAWRMGLMHHERGEHAQALAIYGRGRIDGSQPGQEAVLLAAMASTHLLTGDAKSCQELAGRALHIATESDDAVALAAAHAALMLEASGRDPSAADIHYHAAIEAAKRAGDVLLAVRIRTNRASQLDDQGSYNEALEELEMAIRDAELAGYVERLALALNNRGWTRFHLARLDEAIADFRAAKALYQRAGSLRVCWPLMHMGVVFRERGDLAMARVALDEARPLAEQSRDIQGLIGTRAELARILVVEEPDEAMRLAEAAVAIARSWGALVGALVAAGWVALARGESERAARFAAEAAQEAHFRRNRPGLAESLELQALSAPESFRARLLLEEALAIWREVKNPLGEARAELALARFSESPATRGLVARAEQRFRELGVRLTAAADAAGLLRSLPRPSRPAVSIRTLGGFLVLREGEPVTASEWQSRKARDLLKILIARRGRPTPRDILMDALWPDEQPHRLAKRLSVALATVRAVLDPARRFPSDHFIAGDESALWIDPAHLAVDVLAFLAEAAAGLALQRRGEVAEAREVLAAAEESYAGDFLEEDLYADWAVPLREEARGTYIAVARALARSASISRDWDAAVRYRLRILERDPYDEEAHLGLVSALLASGRHGEARRAYRAYITQMEELEVEPAPFPPAGYPP